MSGEDWLAWHDRYPTSSMSRRLTIVRRMLADALEKAPAGAISLTASARAKGDVRDRFASARRMLGIAEYVHETGTYREREVTCCPTGTQGSIQEPRARRPGTFTLLRLEESHT